MPATTLNDLPPELLDHITTYLPTAQALSNLSRSSKNLRAFVEKDAWQTFSRTHFPSVYRGSTTLSHKATAQSLTTLSKSWDRRAFLSRYIEPGGNIHAFPGDKHLDRWKRPRGQTIGFTPQLDCYETTNGTSRRGEVLAFTAGAEVCLRQRDIGAEGGGNARWTTYRPLESVEGIDDVTCMHLLKPDERSPRSTQEAVNIVTGTANGHLRLIRLPQEAGGHVARMSFTTNGRAVKSSSLLQQPFKQALLAANLGDSHVALYWDAVEGGAEQVQPASEIDIRQHMANGRRGQRAWSTNFISSSRLAIGLGPSEEPLHIYAIDSSGLQKEPLRKFALSNDLDKLDGEITLSGFARRSASSVYPVVPLPPASALGAGSEDGQVFLSGAYDGIIRLHDLRSSRNVEQAYTDPTEDSAIYSLLPRGRETLVAGTSRHTLLKVFDLRLGAKAYSYLDATEPIPDDEPWKRASRDKDTTNWSLFLKPHSATYSGRGGGNNWARRSFESSVYSLASSGPTSPYIYAGVENAVVEMAFTSLLDRHPDPIYSSAGPHKGGKDGVVGGMRAKEVLDLAMHNQAADIKMCTQRSVGETLRLMDGLLKGDGAVKSRDERWVITR